MTETEEREILLKIVEPSLLELALTVRENADLFQVRTTEPYVVIDCSNTGYLTIPFIAHEFEYLPFQQVFTSDMMLTAKWVMRFTDPLAMWYSYLGMVLVEPDTEKIPLKIKLRGRVFR